MIAATINNDIGIAGIAPNAKIMPIKAMEADGTGSEAKLGEGIRYAVDHGAKIVVLSLGLNKYSEYMKDTVKYAEDHDVLLVAATGNEAGSVKYPAAYPSVLSVGGVDANKQKSPLSNFGPELDIVAPFDVYTTWMGGVYDYNRGTSMAAPQVAGVAALVWGNTLT
nr:S8 family serine peptidase [Paenibacillus larvae]